MKRLLIASAAAAAVVAFAVVNATAGGSGGARAGGSIHVVEHATTDAVTNGEPGDAAGNVLTFANDVFDATNTNKVGTDQGYCVRIVASATGSWDGILTTFLAVGLITVEGPFSDTGDTMFAVTGGTGAFRNSRGSMELKFRNAAGTEFDFVFHLVG